MSTNEPQPVALVQTHTCDFLDQLCDGRVVGQGASSRLHVRQLRHKLLDFHHRFGVVAFLQHTRDQRTLASQLTIGPQLERAEGRLLHKTPASTNMFVTVAVATGSKQRAITGGDPSYLSVVTFPNYGISALTSRGKRKQR